MINKKTGENKVIPQRILGTLLNSLSAGVVPRSGLEYIAIGRTGEINAILNDLEHISQGMGAFRFLIGRYGSGKSFLIGLIRSNALDRGYITADTDLSVERRFVGNRGQGLAVFRELMKNLACKTSPDGGALPSILSKWLSSLQLALMEERELPADSPLLDGLMERRIFALTEQLQSLVNGFDFAKVLNAYYRAQKELDETVKADALRWLRGEFNNKTEAKASGLQISTVIDDGNWYEYIKIYAMFFRLIGYKGFAVFFDECVNLYKIPNRVSRENNYEKILSMFNDTLQGKAEGLGIFMGGTPQFLEDERRGLFSYDALKSRLKDGRFQKEGFFDMLSPVLRIARLDDNEMYALIKRVLLLHAQYYAWQPRVTEEDNLRFLKLCAEKIGADSMITPREVIRDYLSVLNILLQNPDTAFDQVVGGGAVTLLPDPSEEEGSESEFDEFPTITI